MIVHVGQQLLVDPTLPKGTAGQIATALAQAQRLAGATYTVKADGTVLAATATIPTETKVLEVIEATADDPAPAAAAAEPNESA